MSMQSHPPSTLHVAARVKTRRRLNLRIDAGTALAVLLGLLVVIQLIARG
jgi:hypothetical protein